MLVLTRKTSEMIQIGESIVVKVIHAGKNIVKIGIEAPDEVRILRAELCETPIGHPLAEFLKARPAVRSKRHAGPEGTRVKSNLPLPR